MSTTKISGEQDEPNNTNPMAFAPSIPASIPAGGLFASRY
jgi:hypothetical protein